MASWCQTKGEYFGYPQCCIDEFGRNPLNQRLEEQNVASNGTGFIPCKMHAIMILRGKIQLKDLITNRQCPFKFPKQYLE